MQESYGFSSLPANLFEVEDMFESVDTVYKQNKFFQEKFALNMPVPVKLGQRFISKKVKGKQTIVKTDVFGY